MCWFSVKPNYVILHNFVGINYTAAVATASALIGIALLLLLIVAILYFRKKGMWRYIL